MEAEAFPIRSTRGVRRRKYHRLGQLTDVDDGTELRARARQLGRLRSRRRVRVLLAGPRRALARARDACVRGMLALARRASALALPCGAVATLWAKRVPQQRVAAPGKPTEFERRLVLEIYKSIVASKELTAMLHSSAAHLPSKTPSAGILSSTHLLDM